MENQLKVLGTEHIGNIKFTGIEGGFGQGKKAMLVQDVALIHGKELRQINQAINMNRNRFKDGIDIIDLYYQSFDLINVHGAKMIQLYHHYFSKICELR